MLQGIIISQTADAKGGLPEDVCPLCLFEKPLIESHLISKGVYPLVRGKANDAILVNSRVIMHTSRQTKDLLLCRECDNSLNKNGENWIIPKLAHPDGQFPLLDILQELPPDAEKKEFKIYEAAKNPSIDVHKIAHFAMGIFWKASAQSWVAHDKAPKIDLGPYRDRVRDFLRGKAPFPANVSLHVLIAPRDRALITIGEPCRGRAEIYRNFSFYVPGIQFGLYVGKQITNEIRQLCFYGNPAHPIVVYDTSEKYLSLMKEMERTAHKSRRVKTLFV
jgi:hypothetical protein